MAYKLNRLTAIRATPAKDSESFDTLGRGVVAFGTGKTFVETATQIKWINILIPPGVVDGWILESNCTQVDDPAPQPLDPESFVRQCTLVDRVFNSVPAIAPWYVSADFLIARALIETGMMTLRFGLPSHDGPFRLPQAEWEAFLSSGLDVAADYIATDVIYPMVQVYAAAFRMHADAKAMSAAASSAPEQPDQGPFLPSYLDLFHCYLTDTATALRLRQNEANAAALLSTVLSQSQIDAITGRSQFSSIKNSETVPQFVAQTEAVLAAALGGAFDKIRTLAGDELPKEAEAPGQSPWFNVAQAELAANVSEAGTPDRIKGYFAATDFGPVGAGIPVWSGAFAAYCIKQGGSANTIPPHSAQPASWTRWGNAEVPLGSHEIPKGSVVVLSPSSDTGSTGHVGFFSAFSNDGKKVRLLGGNQSSRVQESEYPIPRIVAVRVLVADPLANGAANRFDLSAANVKKEFRKYGDLIVDRFQRAGFTKDMHLLAALANAIAESGLDPNIKAAGSEESYGLFQCNRRGGLGRGYSVAQLKDPDINISIVIREARKYSAFTSASTTEAAVAAFVQFVERPSNTAAAIRRRNELARRLQ